IPSNHQTYTLQHTTLSELHLSNIVAKDSSAIGAWQNALSSAPVAAPPVSAPAPAAPPPAPAALPTSEATAWSPTTIYTAGMPVTENGVTYKSLGGRLPASRKALGDQGFMTRGLPGRRRREALGKPDEARAEQIAPSAIRNAPAASPIARRDIAARAPTA